MEKMKKILIFLCLVTIAQLYAIDTSGIQASERSIFYSDEEVDDLMDDFNEPEQEIKSEAVAQFLEDFYKNWPDANDTVVNVVFESSDGKDKMIRLFESNIVSFKDPKSGKQLQDILFPESSDGIQSFKRWMKSLPVKNDSAAKEIKVAEEIQAANVSVKGRASQLDLSKIRVKQDQDK